MLNKVLAKLAALFRSILGEVHWSPPAWASRGATRVSDSRLGAWARANRRRAALAGVGAVAAVIGIAYGTHAFLAYLDSRPKPAYVGVTILPPSPTDPEKKVVGKVLVNFSASAAKMSDLNKDLPSGVTLSPTVAGTWRWVSDRQLAFTPKATVSNDSEKPFDWPAGQEYRVDFDRRFFPEHLAFETRSFKFSTEPVKLQFVKSEFYIDPSHPRVKRVVATVRSNYPLEAEDFKKRVKFTLRSSDAAVLKGPGRSVPVGVTFNPYFTLAFLESEPLELPKDDRVMAIEVADGARTPRGGQPAADGVAINVEVPGLFSAFKVKSAEVVFARNERFEPEQILTLETGVDARSEDVASALEVLLLPADHRPPGMKEIVKNYEWTSPSELTPAVRKDSQPVKLQVVPTENEYSKLHSFKIDVPVLRSLYVKLKKGVKGLGDYELGDDAEQMVQSPDFRPELLFMTKGAILSLSGDKKLPLLARNVDQVEFEIGRVIPSQDNHLISRMLQGGSFSNPYWMEGIENYVSEKFNVTQKLQPKSRSETVYFSLDLEPYLRDHRGFFYVRARSKVVDDGSARTRATASDSRLILVTDLGIIAKKSVSGTTDVFVQDMRTGQPVGDAQVEVVGQNGIAALSVSTSGAGRAQVPDLKDYKNERAPLAFAVKRGQDSSFLPYQLSERQLSLSRFDVGGVYESSESDRLTAMLFSDRGIYRPGDLVNLGLILRSKTWAANLPEMPLLWTVSDPRGNVIKSERFSARPFGLKDLAFATDDTSPTGQYEARVSIVKKEKGRETFDQLGSLTVKVEEFVPDQLRIQAQLEPFRAAGWIPLGALKARVSLQSLFGAPAEDRRVHAQLSLVPVVPSVPAFKEFTFSNPNRKDARTVVENLEDHKTDAKGETTYDIDLAKYQGYFQLRFEAEGFQAEGGRSVTSVAAVAVSGLPHLVGYKADGDLHYINRAAERSVKLIAIDPSQKAAEAKGLKRVTVERKYVSTLLRQDDGTYKYQSVRKEQELKSEPLSVGREGLTLKLPTEAPGDFAWLIKDAEDHELNRIEFNVVGEANLARSLDRSAELQLALNKTDLKPGEELEVQIKAPYKGAGLITIERDAVYAHKWFKAASATTVERIRIPEGLEGNAYVSVAFLRAVDSKEIFMSPLSYGTQPFSISLDQHRTKITLDAPTKVKPGAELAVRYSADRPTQLVLYGVDEGILQVARYRLPDPIQHFFRKRALQIQTFQLLDLLLPEYSVLKELSAPGGDEGLGALGKNLNPFKRKDQPPATFWSGVLKADSQARVYKYRVPEYFNGNMKIMAVASSDRGLGSAETAALSRGDFVIQPTAPLFVAPSDEFVIGVNVSNQLEEPGAPSKLQVSLTPSAELETVGDATRTVDVAPGREKPVEFKLRALPKPGSGNLVFKVAAGGHSARLATAVSVRPAVPYVTSVKMGLAEDLPLSLAIDRPRLVEYRKTELSASVVPVALGRGLSDFLVDFPYGCTEQVISKAVPSLVFRGRSEFAFAPGKAAEFHQNVLAMLRTRQTSDGGFGLYSGAEHAYPPASLYAIRYLIEAHERGMPVPDDVRQRATQYLLSRQLKRVDGLASARLFAEALYLQARMELVPTNDLNFLREALEKNLKGQWEKDVTAIYLAGTYALIQQQEKGLALLRGFEPGAPMTPDYDHYQDSLVRDAVLVQIAARHFPQRLKELVKDDPFRSMIRPIQRGQFSTYSSAQVLLALEAMLSAGEKGGFAGELSLRETVGGGERDLAFRKGLVALATPAPDATSVKIDGPKKLPVFYSLTQAGFDRDLPKKESSQGLEVSRLYFSASGSQVDKVKLGDQVTVSLRARSLGKAEFDHLVLVDLYPAGFELVANAGGASSVAPGADEAPAPAEGEGEGASEEGAFYLPGWPRWLVPAAYADDSTGLTAMSTSFVDFREDRVVVYAHASEDIREFRYQLKAVNRGAFIVPPPFGESMYDRSIQHRGAASRITIE